MASIERTTCSAPSLRPGPGLIAVFLALSLQATAGGRVDAVWMRGGHAGGGGSATWSPDGRHFATAGDDYTIKIWRASDRHLVRTMHGHGGGYGPGVQWSPAGDRLVSFSWDQSLRLWNAETGEELFSEATGDWQNVAQFSPDGSIIASGGFEDVVTVRDSETFQVLRTLPGHTDGLNDIAFSPDGSRMATMAQDRAIRIFDTGDWSLLRTIPSTHDFFGVSVQYSRDGSLLGSCGGLDIPAIKLWNPDTGALVRFLSMGGGSGPAVGIDFSADGRYVAAGRNTGVRVFSMQNFSLVAHVPAAGSVEFAFDGDTFLGIHFTNGDPFPVALFGVQEAAMVDRFMTHSSVGTAVAFSPNGEAVASAAAFFDSSIQVWDSASGERLQSLAYTINGDGLSSVDFSPDGLYIAGGGGDWDQSTQIWRRSDGQRVAVLPQGPNRIPGLDFAPDSTRIATGSDSGTVAIWSAPGGGLLDVINVAQVRSLRWSPEVGGPIAVGDSVGGVQFVDPSSGQIVRTISAHSSSVNSVDFSKDGRRILTGSSDGLLRLWRVSDGALLRSYAGHSGPVSSVDLSNDDNLVLSASFSGGVKLWNASTGAELVHYTEETGIPGLGVTGVAFAPDQRTFVYVRADSSLIMARAPLASPYRPSRAAGQLLPGN